MIRWHLKGLNNCSDYEASKTSLQNVRYCAKTSSDMHNIEGASRLFRHVKFSWYITKYDKVLM